MGNKKIDYRFKIIYAIGIVMVVASHCSGGGISLFYDWFSFESFGLALFVFASGYFYNRDSENKSIKYIIKKAKHLLLPVYLWNIFYALLVYVLSYKGFTIGGKITLEKILISPITSGHQFIYNMGGWFVIPLFMIQVYNVSFRKICSKIVKNINEYFYFIINILLGMIGIYLASEGFNTGWWLVLIRMLVFVPFFGLGILYKSKLEKYDTMQSIWYFSIVFSIKLLIFLILKRTSVGYTYSWCNNFVDGPIIPIIVGFLGIAFWIRVSKLLEPIMKENKYISLIADNSYSIMINQFAGFMTVKTVIALLNKIFGICNSFNFVSYKTNIWYYYIPYKINQFRIVYLVAGIVVPIIMSFVIKNILKKVQFYTKERYIIKAK